MPYASNILPSKIEEALHEQLYFQYGSDNLTEWCLLGVANRRCIFNFDFPKRIAMYRYWFLCFGVDLGEDLSTDGNA